MKKYILVLVIAGLVTACENNIPYKSAGVTPRLTMNGFINTDSLTNIIYLNYTGIVEPGHVDEASVEVYVNDEFKETAEEMEPKHGGDKQKRYLIRSRFKPDDKVRIEARTADGKHHAWVEETVPQPIEILDIDTADIPLRTNDYFMLKRLRVKFRFKDRPNEKNYYRVAAIKTTYIKGIIYGEEQTVFYSENSFWPWDDLVLTEGRPVTTDEMENELFERIQNKYGVFDDNMFKDTEYTMNL